jgi:hypothetical protein
VPRRSVTLNGAPVVWTTQGVLPGDFAKIGGGLDARIGRGSVFLRGDVSTGGGNRIGTVRGGVSISL